MQDLKDSIINLDGYTTRQFEEIKEVFTDSFEKNQEVGAAVAVCHRAQLVVDLAAGIRDRDYQPNGVRLAARSHSARQVLAVRELGLIRNWNSHLAIPQTSVQLGTSTLAKWLLVAVPSHAQSAHWSL